MTTLNPATVATLVLGSLLLVASVPPVGAFSLGIDKVSAEIGSWTIGYNNGMEGCTTTVSYPDRTTIWIGYRRDKDSPDAVVPYVALAGEKFAWVTSGNVYRIKIQFPSIKYEWEFEARAFNRNDDKRHKGLMFGRFKSQFFDHLKASDYLTLVYGARRVVTQLGLNGSSDAIDKMFECQKQHIASRNSISEKSTARADNTVPPSQSLPIQQHLPNPTHPIGWLVVNVCAATGYESPECKKAKECLKEPALTTAETKHLTACKGFNTWLGSPEGKPFISIEQQRPCTREVRVQRSQHYAPIESVTDPVCQEKLETARDEIRRKLKAEQEVWDEESERQAGQQTHETQRYDGPLGNLLDMFRVQTPDYKDPSALLKRAYDDYITVKACYEIRKGYKYVWINGVQMYEAKQYMGEIETKLSLPNKDDLWEKVDYNGKRNFLIMSMNTNGLGPDGERVLCQNSLNELQNLYEKVLSPKLKKDF
jgi:hypothetical protein